MQPPEPKVNQVDHQVKSYNTFEELLEAETNGWVVVGVSSRRGTVPHVVGPFDDRDEALRARVRLRRQWRKEEEKEGHTVQTFVRPLWKDTTTSRYTKS